MSLSTLASRPLNPPLLFACPPAHQLPRTTITIDPTYTTHHPAPSSRHGTRLHVSSLQVQSPPTPPPIHPPRHACLTVILLVRIRHCTLTLVHVDILLRPFIQPIHSRTTPSPSRKHGTSLHVPSLPLPTLPTLTPLRLTCAAKRGLRGLAYCGQVLLGRLVHRPILLRSSVAHTLENTPFHTYISPSASSFSPSPSLLLCPSSSVPLSLSRALSLSPLLRPPPRMC